MALKLVVDDLVEVIGPLRAEYQKGADGKFHLVLDGDPPRLVEFRNRNVDLMKRNEALIAQAGADKATLAELLAKPDVGKQTADLEAQLAAERAAHRGTRLAHEVSTQFLKVGGRPNAVDHVVTEAAKVFAVDDAGKLTSQEFSATNPAEPLSLTEWMKKQADVADYLFLPSSGG